MSRPAVVLLSGGLDSSTVLAIAQDQGFTPTALSFDYNQRHRIELEAARRVVEAAGVERHVVLSIPLDLFGGSALTDRTIAVPVGRAAEDMAGAIPDTYVPGRNTIFLSCALALAETIGSSDIFIGVNALDYSGYPDCRPEFIEAFERLAHVATAAAVTGQQQLKIHAPLMEMTKADIVRAGSALGVDYGLTISCYQADEHGACGRCDSCTLRLKGFAEASLHDPATYRSRP